MHNLTLTDKLLQIITKAQSKAIQRKLGVGRAPLPTSLDPTNTTLRSVEIIKRRGCLEGDLLSDSVSLSRCRNGIIAYITGTISSKKYNACADCLYNGTQKDCSFARPSSGTMKQTPIQLRAIKRPLLEVEEDEEDDECDRSLKRQALSESISGEVFKGNHVPCRSITSLALSHAVKKEQGFDMCTKIATPPEQSSPTTSKQATEEIEGLAEEIRLQIFIMVTSLQNLQRQVNTAVLVEKSEQSSRDFFSTGVNLIIAHAENICNLLNDPQSSSLICSQRLLDQARESCMRALKNLNDQTWAKAGIKLTRPVLDVKHKYEIVDSKLEELRCLLRSG